MDKCEMCGNEYRKKNCQQKYCSQPCKADANRKKNRVNQRRINGTKSPRESGPINIIYDPLGDFTGKKMSTHETYFMIQESTFEPLTLIEITKRCRLLWYTDPGRYLVVPGLHRMELRRSTIS